MRTLDQLVGPSDFVWDECQKRSIPLTERDGGSIFVVAHHSVSRTLQSILDTFHSPVRSVSANAAVGPRVAGQDAYESRHTVPWNTHRAYTTASWIDDQAFTFEMANLSLGGAYPVGSTGKEWLAELVAAMHVELGMPIDRWHVTCHSEIYERGWDSYATACCGPDLRAALDWVCEEALRIVAGETEEDDVNTDMKIYGGPGGSQKFIDAMGADDIGEFFFVPQGGPDWATNIYAAWAAFGEPENLDTPWHFDLARHIADQRWAKKRGQIVTETTQAVVPALVAAIKPLFAALAPQIDMAAVEASVRQATEAALADVVITPEPLNPTQIQQIAKASADEEDRRERERLGQA